MNGTKKMAFLLFAVNIGLLSTFKCNAGEIFKKPFQPSVVWVKTTDDKLMKIHKEYFKLMKQPKDDYAPLEPNPNNSKQNPFPFNLDSTFTELLFNGLKYSRKSIFKYLLKLNKQQIDMLYMAAHAARALGLENTLTHILGPNETKRIIYECEKNNPAICPGGYWQW